MGLTPREKEIKEKKYPISSIHLQIISPLAKKGTDDKTPNTKRGIEALVSWR